MSRKGCKMYKTALKFLPWCSISASQDAVHISQVVNYYYYYYYYYHHHYYYYCCCCYSSSFFFFFLFMVRWLKHC